MASDSILRCKINVRCRGIEAPQIIDAVQSDGAYLIVLEWGTDSNDGQTMTPRQFVRIEAQDVEIEPSADSPFELISRIGINLDEAVCSDLPERLKCDFIPSPIQD